MNATGTSDRTGSCTGGETTGVEGTEQGSSEPPEPSSEHIFEGRGCTVEVSCHVAEVDVVARWLRDRMQEIVKRVGVQEGGVSIGIVDDVAMAALHRNHLGVASPTDVLTFDLRENATDCRSVDVDMAVNHEEAVRHAEQHGHDVALELLLYAVHGLLHVTGHDDHDLHAASLMHRREDELIKSIGLPPVYGEVADGCRGRSQAASAKVGEVK